MIKNPKSTADKRRKLDNPEDNPWVFRGKREVFDNWLINLSLHDLTNLSGNPAEYVWVGFKNKAVGVVAIDGDEIWLVGQYRYTIGQYSWELPEGGCPPGKDTLDAAKWELAEETGLRAQRYQPLVELHTSNGITDEWAIVYLATGLTQGEAQPEENEELQTRKISIDDLVAEIDAGKITDAMTVAAGYKLALMKARGEI